MAVRTAESTVQPVRIAQRWTGSTVTEWLPVALVAIVIAWLVLPPLFVIIQTSFSVRGGASLTLENYRAVSGSIGLTSALVTNSLAFSGGSAIFALAFGTLLAWLAERTNTPFKGAVYMAAFVSFAIPAIIKVIGWILLLGPRAGL